MCFNEGMRGILLLVVCICVVVIAASLGSLMTIPAIDGWYSGLAKPWFSPPNWLFGPVWTVLYLMMAVAWYLTLARGWNKKTVRTANWRFLAQLLVNVSWSGVFFGLKELLAAFMVLLLLWWLIWVTIKAMLRVDRRAAWLMLPYLVWVSFAGVLNFSVMWLNW